MNISGGSCSAERFQQRQLVFLGQTPRGQFAVAEIAVAARVLVIKQIAVRPGEVEGQRQRAAHAPILEFVTPGIHDETLHAGVIAMCQLFFDDAAIGELRPDIIARPLFGIAHQREIEFAGLERLEMDSLVRIIFIGDAFEIEHAASGAQRARPVVRITHIGDVFAESVLIDRVRAAADGRCARQLVECLALAPLMREHLHLRSDQVQFGIALDELETHRALVDHHRLLDIRPVKTELWVALVALERIEADFYIFGQHRIAVGKTCARIKAESDRKPVVG